jgi:NAD(P) transhydrogenase
MTDHYDLIIIGAGPAGKSAAELAAGFGRRTLIIEQQQPGGVVTTTGGAPTKTLREAALYLTGFRQEEVYGVRAAVPLDVALPLIGKRTEQVRRLLQSVVAQQIAERGIAYLQGSARLTGSGHVCVTLPDETERRLTAQTILITTGSRPTHFPGISFDDPAVYDSDQIYSIKAAPRSIVIVGGGPVGVEFATVFTALGIPVTLVNQAERLLLASDGEVAGLMAEEFVRRGVKLILSEGVATVQRRADQLTVILASGGTLATDAVLFAAGRTPNTTGLGLAEAGVQLDDRGRIVVDRYFRTSAPGIYAAGDVVSPALASTAMQQGRAAACHACGLLFGVEVDQAESSAVYSLPEVAGVGLTEEAVRAADIPYVVGRCDLATTARGAIAGHGGRLKLIFRADNRKLLGVHCIGDIASEVVGLGHLALHVGSTVEIFLTLALNTPTYSAAYHDAAVDGLARLAEVMGYERRTGHHERHTATDENR